MAATSTPEVLANGRYLRLVDRGGWEYAERHGASGVVAVTDERELVLVEQYRPALDARVIELPAGLVGDLPDARDEGFREAAQRELVEETGYRASQLEEIGAGPSSSGLCNEIVCLFSATGLRKVGPGGGDASESIRVHCVALGGARAWLEARRVGGTLVEPRIYAGLCLAGIGI